MSCSMLGVVILGPEVSCLGSGVSCLGSCVSCPKSECITVLLLLCVDAVSTRECIGNYRDDA